VDTIWAFEDLPKAGRGIGSSRGSTPLLTGKGAPGLFKPRTLSY
jgi:hypothetical protein